MRGRCAVCVCMCVCLCAKECMPCYTYERKRQIWRSWLLPSWGLIWDHEVWKEVPLPTEPYHIFMLHLKYALASGCWASLYLPTFSLPPSFPPSILLSVSFSLPPFLSPPLWFSIAPCSSVAQKLSPAACFTLNAVSSLMGKFLWAPNIYFRN